MISNFDGKYFFLSNFSPHPVTYNGLTYSTSEHAYQAAKAVNKTDLIRIALAETPKEAKKIGRSIDCGDDWDQVKDQVMRNIVWAKFYQDIELTLLLVDTEDEELVEGNYWNDTYWGVCKGVGENRLGKILMDTRTELQSRQNWIDLIRKYRS